MKKQNSHSINLLGILLGIILLNVLASFYFTRIDLTQNNRYTLSKPAKDILAAAEQPLVIEVYLKGDFPSEYKRLQNETRYLLEEFSAYNSAVKFQFINPLEKGENANQVAQRFYQAGMTPEVLNVYENGKMSESMLFPWAVASYGDKEVSIKLMTKNIGDSNEEIVNSSVQSLEYAFADGFKKLLQGKNKKIAVMRGNGEYPDAYIADFIQAIKDYYYIAPFTLDSVATQAQKTLDQLNEYDLILEARPTQAYTEKEKYVLDQYLMQGGKALWLTEKVKIDKDSLFTSASNTALAFPQSLNLEDFFFKYGLRIQPSLVNDINSAPIVLASGSGEQTQFNPYPWFYSPLALPQEKHPITNNVEAVKFDFANPMDTLKNSIKKTILLSSSKYTKIEGTPKPISLDIINEKPKPEEYRHGSQALAVLLEGEFTSVYKNRIKPFEATKNLDQGKKTKMLVISDGNVIKNEFRKNQPQPLGFDRYTGTTYGNKEFLVNATNYLLDDTGLLDLRSKKIKIAFLDNEKLQQEKLFWQLLNILAPLLLLGIFAVGFVNYRKYKYRR